jgi:glycosyltransferase involved in cell wall biosynthesis
VVDAAGIRWSGIGSKMPPGRLRLGKSVKFTQATRRFDVAFYIPQIGPLVAADGAPTPAGGAETQIFLLARALVRRGLDVCLIAFDLPEVEIPPSVEGVDVVVRPPYRHRARLSRLHEAGSVLRAIVNVDSSVVVTRAAGPDIGLAAIAARLSGRRFVYSSANVSDFEFVRVSPKLSNRALFRLGTSLANELIVQTEEQRRLCEERLGRKAIVIRSIAEPAPRRLAPPEAFLWIGRLVWYKRPLAFIELARSVPDATFWMIGVPSEHAPEGEELLAAVVQEASQTPNLHLCAPRPRAELLSLIERAVAIVNTADFEGMPNIFLEGWARGVPALSLSHDPDGVIEANSLGAFAHGSPLKFAELAHELWEKRRHDQADVAERCQRYLAANHSGDVIAARWQEALDLRRQAP